MKLKTTRKDREEYRKSTNNAFFRMVLDDFATLETALRESQDDADAQRMIAENFMDAFASTPSELLADGLEAYIAQLTAERDILAAELTLAKQVTANALHELRSAIAVLKEVYAKASLLQIDTICDEIVSWLTLHAQQTKAPIELSPHVCDFCACTETTDCQDNPWKLLRTFTQNNAGLWTCNVCEEEDNKAK